MDLKPMIVAAGDATEITGVALIVGGLLIATLRFAARGAAGAAFSNYRSDLGRAILLGLEVLVAADIIRTVAFTPTMDSVLVLALIVVIRTFLSWTLALELDGHWPWQRAAARAPSASAPATSSSTGAKP